MAVPEFSPKGTHDIIPPRDMGVAIIRTRRALESRYQDDCSVFRAEVFGKLATHGAMKRGMGWAVFNTDEDEGSVAIADGQKQILVAVYVRNGTPRKTYNRPIPTVRIISNEHIVGVNGNFGMATSDFVLDNENDSQYFVDCITTLDGDGMVRVPDLESINTASSAAAEEGNEPAPVRSNSPVIIVDEYEQIRVGNAELGFVPGGNVLQEFAPHDTENGCLPFGHFSCFEDRIQALAVGRELLGSVLGLEPTYCGTF